MKNERYQDYKILAKARANIYKLLSQTYLSEPSKQVLTEINKSHFLTHLSTMSPKYSKACNTVQEFLHTLKRNTNYTQLKQEYMNLFLVPTHQYVRPYESVYRDKLSSGNTPNGLVMGKSTIAIKKIYEQSGAKISEKYRDLPDHFGLELAFMQFMCEKEAESWDNGAKKMARTYLTSQKSFLTDHLAQWSNDICLEIFKLAKLGYYKGMAEITRKYIADDEAEVTKIIQETTAV